MNLRPSGYEPDELPDCSTPQQVSGLIKGCGAFVNLNQALHVVVRESDFSKHIFGVRAVGRGGGQHVGRRSADVLPGADPHRTTDVRAGGVAGLQVCIFLGLSHREDRLHATVDVSKHLRPLVAGALEELGLDLGLDLGAEVAFVEAAALLACGT